MSVKIEVVREDVHEGRHPRPWRVERFGEGTAVESASGEVITRCPRDFAFKIVDAVNAIPPRKGKIEKFVVEMDPETFRRLAAIACRVAGDPVAEFRSAARDCVGYVPNRGVFLTLSDAECVREVIADYAIKEDA